MRSRRPRGLFLVLEGLDGAGTTTQAARLAVRLQGAGVEVHTTAEPSRGPVGAGIRQVLRGSIAVDRRALALMFAADRLDHLAREIEPKLAAGVHVVCDRYVMSSLAYQSLDAPLAWIERINSLAPPPDLTLFLRVPPRVALARRRSATGARELFETLPQLTRIAAAYERDVVRLGRRHRIRAIDGEAPIEAVAEAIGEAVERRLGLV